MGILASKFSTRLKAVLDSKGEGSRKKLAEAIDTDPNTVSKWVTSKQTPNIKKVELIASTLNVDPAWLMGADTAEKPTPETIIAELQKLLNVQPLAPIEPIRKGPELPDHIPDKVIHLLRKFPANANWKVISSFLEQSLKLLDSEQSQGQSDPDAQDP